MCPSDRLARAVHIGHGFEGQHLDAVDPAFGRLALEAPAVGPLFDRVDQLVEEGALGLAEVAQHIAMEPADPSLIKQITGLIEQSARQTTNRLQYYRLAFGAAGGFGSEVGLDHAKAAMEAFFGDQKIELEFDPGLRTERPAVVKLLMNLARNPSRRG